MQARLYPSKYLATIVAMVLMILVGRIVDVFMFMILPLMELGERHTPSNYSLIDIPLDATTITIVQKDLDEFSDSNIPIFLEVTYALNIPFLTSDPCNCSNGLDLDNSNVNEFAQEVITISGGVPDYTVTTVNNLYDSSGTLLTPATATALLVGPDASGNYTITAYVPADDATIYDITVQDFNRFEGDYTAIAACPPCCGANNGTTTLTIGSN